MARLPGPLTLAPLAVFAAMAGAFVIGTGQPPEGKLPGLLDRPLPEFSLAPMAGTDVGFGTQDLRGEVGLINVFASWCSSCRQEHATLLDLAATQTVPIYGVNWKDAKGAGKLYLQRSGNPYVATGDDSAGLLGNKLNVTGVPETYIVDADGRMRYRHLGPITPEIWENIFLPLLKDLDSAS